METAHQYKIGSGIITQCKIQFPGLMGFRNNKIHLKLKVGMLESKTKATVD
jgi:hypothetical protein